MKNKENSVRAYSCRQHIFTTTTNRKKDINKETHFDFTDFLKAFNYVKELRDILKNKVLRIWLMGI